MSEIIDSMDGNCGFFLVFNDADELSNGKHHLW